MKRWGFAGAIVALLVGVSPADAVKPPGYAGAGAVSGTVTYGRPLPGLLKACAPKLPVEIRLSSSAFTLKTPTGVQVVPLTVAATGVASCDSESAGGATMPTVAIQAGGLQCAVRGGYTHVGPHYTFIASSATPCSFDGDGDGTADAAAPGHSWMFQLSGSSGVLAGTVVYQPY